MKTTLGWAAADVGRPWSATAIYVAAALLRAASDVLARLATRLSVVEAVAPPLVVEFHSLYREAGAPEGALYVDGELVGVIPGVTRL